MAFPVADSYSVGFGQSVNAGRSGVVAPGFEYAYERASFNPTGSSIVLGGGVAGSDLFKINPLLQSSATTGTNAHLNPSVDVVGVNGLTPTFQFLLASARHPTGTWQVGRKPMYSTDNGANWVYFSDVGVKDTGNDWVQFRHNAPFGQNKVRIGVSRQMSVHQHGTRIAALAASFGFVEPAPSAVAYTPTANVSDYAAQAYIANEFAAQTDSLSRAVPITPFYVGQINDTSLMPASGPKKVWLIHGGTHAGEDMGDFSMWILLNWLCGSATAAQELRRNFRIIFQPMTTPQGRAGGGWRGIWGGAPDDPNRNAHLDNMQAITHSKSANTADFLGLPLKIFYDFHGTFESKYEVYAGANTARLNLLNKLVTITGFTVANPGDGVTGFKSLWYGSSAADGFTGAVLSATIEHGDPTPTSDAELQTWGEAIGTATYQMFLEGVFA